MGRLEGPAVSADVSVYERDVWIVSYLSSAPDDRRTIRDIWEEAKRPRVANVDSDGVRERGGIEEKASLPTYHRTVGKLAARGLLLMDEAAAGKTATYRVAPQISSVTPLSQTDLNEALWELGATQAIALYADTVEQFERDSASVLGRAAEALMVENPRELVLRMLQDQARELDEDIADLRDPDTAEEEHRRRVARRLVGLARFVHGEIGLNPTIWRVPAIEEVDETVSPRDVASIERIVRPHDWEPVRAELAQHVFGATFIEYTEIASETDDRPRLVVAGSDGSSHVGLIRGMPAAAYSDEDRLLLTFNNSVGYVEVPATYPVRYPSPYHGVPITRAALEDPNNKGMIISRPWFEDLEDGEFEHMKKAALDVVQFRIDHALLAGLALPYGSHPIKGGEALPKPNLLIRDGTVSPQARELQNYTNPTAYGEVVREGIQLSYRLLRLVMESDRRVYAGAVKSTQLRTFSKIVNWYIQRGSAERFGQPIDPTWDRMRMGAISDSVAMTRLLASLPALSRRSQYYRTCVIVRPFPAMVTSLFRSQPGTEAEDWIPFFEDEAAQASARYRTRGGNRPYYDGRDIAEDEYVHLCVYGDYGMFYIGKPGGSPQIVFPRFEFLDSIRTLRSTDARDARVQRIVSVISEGVHRTSWSLDYEHNMMTDQKMPKIIPFVVSQSHEMCKVLGHKLANELQQAIAASLSAMKALRGLAVPRIDIEPVSMEKFAHYLERMKRFVRRQGEALGDSPPDAAAAAARVAPRLLLDGRVDGADRARGLGSQKGSEEGGDMSPDSLG